MSTLVQHIGPNAVVTQEGLVVDGIRRQLRHSVELARIVFNTSVAVIEVLTTLFPKPCAVPLPQGETEPSGLEPWDHLNANALAFAAATPGSEAATKHGTVVLQWCVAAVAAAEMASHPIRETAPYLVVELLANEGPAALTCSPDDYLDYLEWVAYQHSPQFQNDVMEGCERPSLRPAPAAICAPWPEALGFDLGGPDKVLENTLRVASDIFCGPTQSYMKLRRNSVATTAGNELRAQFDAEFPLAERVSASYSFDLAQGGQNYFIRAQRTSSAKGPVYTFRVLRSGPGLLESIAFPK